MAQLLGGVETAVGVWQEEVWRGVSDLRAMHVSLAQPAHEWLYDCRSADVITAGFGSGRVSCPSGFATEASGCGSMRWKGWAAGVRVAVMRTRSPLSGALRATCPAKALRPTSREPARP